VKNILSAFFWGAILIVLVSTATSRGLSFYVVNTGLDESYWFTKRHLWELYAITSLFLGIWFSVARRRILLSVIFLVLAFLSAFVFPFLLQD